VYGKNAEFFIFQADGANNR